MQAVTPDPADLASAKGIVLLMVLMGNSPLEDEFDECSAEVCQPGELVRKELLPAHGDKSSPGWPLTLTPGQQAKIKHSVAIALLTGLTFRGRDAWVTYVKKALEAYGPTQHMLGPQLATVEGDTAHCRTDVQALHYMKDEPTKTLTLWAAYNTDMRRVGGEWKIARHHLEARGTRIQEG